MYVKLFFETLQRFERLQFQFCWINTRRWCEASSTRGFEFSLQIEGKITWLTIYSLRWVWNHLLDPIGIPMFKMLQHSKQFRYFSVTKGFCLKSPWPVPPCHNTGPNGSVSMSYQITEPKKFQFQHQSNQWQLCFFWLQIYMYKNSECSWKSTTNTLQMSSRWWCLTSVLCFWFFTLKSLTKMFQQIIYSNTFWSWVGWMKPPTSFYLFKKPGW